MGDFLMAILVVVILFFSSWIIIPTVLYFGALAFVAIAVISSMIYHIIIWPFKYIDTRLEIRRRIIERESERESKKDE